MALPERESMDFDVVVVGAGPAGLATAIRLKQRAAEIGEEISVVVVEKGSEVGAHILSGAVIDPIGLDRLLPEWRTDPERPLKTEVQRDEFMMLTKNSGITLPERVLPQADVEPRQLRRLAVQHLQVSRRAGRGARRRDLSGLPGLRGAVRRERRRGGHRHGRSRHRQVRRARATTYTRGMELRGKYTVFGEGARGNLTKGLIRRFELNRHSDHFKYGLGVKELWQLAPGKFEPGLVQHTMGWPLPNRAGGGSWLYHFDDHLLSVGFVTHLNYENPTLSPFEEFQRFKTHPMIAETFEGAKRIGHGAQAIMEGGWRSVPKLVFPGGCLVGCSAGFVNVPRIKGLAQRDPVRHAGGRRHRGRPEGGPRRRRAHRLRGRLARQPDRAGPEGGAQRQAALVQVRDAGRRGARRDRHVGDQHPRRLAVRHALARQAGSRLPQAALGGDADRLPEAGRQADLRPALLGLPVEHQPRGGPAAPPEGPRPGA